MMSIDLGDEIDRDGEIFAQGELRIEDFRESFLSSLKYWSRTDYLSQWEEGLDRLVRKHDRSALITDMHPPETANFIDLWILYRVGDLVCFQNKLLFLDQIESPFLEGDPYSHVQDRITHNPEGQKISEWSTSISHIRMAIDKLSAA